MIRTEHLTKTYGGFTAVDDVSFEARPGVVTGFLGPNGAGKSTLLRLVCGLTRPTSGQALVLGRPYAALPNPAGVVGTLLDAGAQHSGRTGREILTLATIAVGRPRQRVDELLELVGLSADEAGRRLRHYSLGMRQRLGIAQALVGDPRVLILDEPANGLDPQGIRWMRDLLVGLAEQGRTVLLSSHLLHEIELIADELVLIGRGRIVASGPKNDLLAGSGTLASCREPRQLVEALTRAGIVVPRVDVDTVLAEASSEQVARVALGAGILITGLRSAEGTGLEALFLELTADTDRSGVAA